MELNNKSKRLNNYKKDIKKFLAKVVLKVNLLFQYLLFIENLNFLRIK